ncbi:hypothetical protein [Parabacteroides faecis]|uniref:hypothetical protein n=1 Tax=Parabacteroides faecis TaxID=1217282 RepID=UPI002164FE0F|nr:hypothetical protein [Parabacteroides faecis]MCS2893900.1 hypothetical protein [Parabacteroides faecis]
MKGGQEKVADIYTNKCINIKKVTSMNKYDDKDSVAVLNRSLGINLEEIINDPQLNDDQKFKAIYGKVLTALLTKWINNDTTGELGLPEGFNVDEFVKQQVTGASKTEVDYIPNILVVPNYAKELKNARGDEVRKQVVNLFNLAHTVINSHRFDVNSVAQMMFGAGVLALNLIGAVASVVAFRGSNCRSYSNFWGSIADGIARCSISYSRRICYWCRCSGNGFCGTSFHLCISRHYFYQSFFLRDRTE